MRIPHFVSCSATTRTDVCAILLAFLLTAGAAYAQLPSPPIQLPTLPLNVPSEIGTNRALERIAELERRDLAGQRLRSIRDLLQRHGDRLEADPNGDPAVRGEVVAYLPSAALLDKARADGFTIVRHRTLPELDASIVVLRPREGVSTREGVRRLLELAPDEVFDFNHLYGDGGQATSDDGLAPTAASRATTAGAQRRLGLIDGGIDGDTEALRNIRIHRDGCAGRTVAGTHGTAVASLMVGNAERFRGAAPGAELFAVDVYCGEPTGGSVEAIAAAFAWIAAQDVAVINVSLVGPPNRILERVVGAMVVRGHLIVAAVGNDGPAAPALYPAAYPGVIGVTAVDATAKILPEAARGPQVTFAAPGTGMAAASAARGGYANVRGTSFAAPVVAGLLALHCDKPGRTMAQRALARLIAAATDLGAPGKDPVYGYGLVGKQSRLPTQ